MKIIASQKIKNQKNSPYGKNNALNKSKKERRRGGREIGLTRSGKSIYMKKYSHEYTDFTKQDHIDAANLHLENTSLKKHKMFESNLRSSHAESHRQAANVLYEDLKKQSNLIITN